MGCAQKQATVQTLEIKLSRQRFRDTGYTIWSVGEKSCGRYNDGKDIIMKYRVVIVGNKNRYKI